MLSIFLTLFFSMLCEGSHHLVVNHQANYSECRNDELGSRFVCCLHVGAGTPCPMFWSNETNSNCATAKVQLRDSKNFCPTSSLNATYSTAEATCTALGGLLCKSDMTLYSPGLMYLGCGTDNADSDSFTIRTMDECTPSVTSPKPQENDKYYIIGILIPIAAGLMILCICRAKRGRNDGSMSPGLNFV